MVLRLIGSVRVVVVNVAILFRSVSAVADFAAMPTNKPILGGGAFVPRRLSLTVRVSLGVVANKIPPPRVNFAIPLHGLTATARAQG